MIDRYTRPEMGSLWTLENRFRVWLEVELAVCEAWTRLGVIPAAEMAEIRAKAISTCRASWRSRSAPATT
jgi:adenylosuccinate lyase